MYDLLLKVKEMEEERKRERNQVEAREDTFVAAGEQTEQNIAGRRRMVGDSRTGSMRSTFRERAVATEDDSWKKVVIGEI